MRRLVEQLRREDGERGGEGDEVMVVVVTSRSSPSSLARLPPQPLHPTVAPFLPAQNVLHHSLNILHCRLDAGSVLGI